jgi:hypothetical protein
MTNLTIRSGSPDALGDEPSVFDPLTGRAARSRWRFLRLITDPASLIPTFVGVVVAAAGFALIGYAWAKVAGLVDVWKQMPYVVSAGLPGLGLVMTGLVIVNVSARRQDGAARARQMATLTEAMRDLQQSLDR